MTLDDDALTFDDDTVPLDDETLVLDDIVGAPPWPPFEDEDA